MLLVAINQFNYGRTNEIWSASSLRLYFNNCTRGLRPERNETERNCICKNGRCYSFGCVRFLRPYSIAFSDSPLRYRSWTGSHCRFCYDISFVSHPYQFIFLLILVSWHQNGFPWPSNASSCTSVDNSSPRYPSGLLSMSNSFIYVRAEKHLYSFARNGLHQESTLPDTIVSLPGLLLLILNW